MSEEGRIAHNAEYLRLSAEHVRRHDELMGSPMKDWPEALKSYGLQRWGAERPGCGDEIAVMVADWIRAGEPRPNPLRDLIAAVQEFLDAAETRLTDVPPTDLQRLGDARNRAAFALEKDS